jgi:NADH-quinone oxidoreductase subunit M
MFVLLSLIAPKGTVKYVGIAGAVASLFLTIAQVVQFNPSSYHTILNPAYTMPFGLTFEMGFDGIGLLMVMLTNVIVPLILLSNFNKAESEDRLFNAMTLFMQFGLIGVFTAMDGIMFYIFWELTLIPIFVIAYVYGSGERKKTLMKFFIYTFVGSLAMLLSLIAIGAYAEDFSYVNLLAVQLESAKAYWIMGGFFLAFAIKIPLFPFHTWQPDTYSTAPTAGTMLLSALMLKMALYGMIRWMIPLAPEALSDFKYIIIVLGLIGIIYAAIIAIKQQDIKRLFAFASISHVGLIAAGIVLFDKVTLSAVFIQILNHSFVAIGLFLAAGILEHRMKTRMLPELGGIAQVAPRFAFWFAVICFASVSVPFTSGFIGEFLLLKGLYIDNWIIGSLAGTTLVFGAVYTLRAYQLSMFGHKDNLQFEDLTWNEWITFFVLALLTLTIGIYPELVTNFIDPSLDKLYLQLQSAKTILP